MASAASRPRRQGAPALNELPASAPRLALVVGNANYVKLGRLGNPGRDARLMADKLRQLGFDVT
ncbi:MAG: caspase family protein, partial [Geodermatophilales bacterium]|nr:caspase family protein [Geodermatophilales bacterium]